jgi:hypothetical protein
MPFQLIEDDDNAAPITILKGEDALDLWLKAQYPTLFIKRVLPTLSAVFLV